MTDSEVMREEISSGDAGATDWFLACERLMAELWVLELTSVIGLDHPVSACLGCIYSVQ